MLFRFNDHIYKKITTAREKHIFQLITWRIKELDSHAEVILYGSRARGQGRADSDWNILVFLDRDDVFFFTKDKPTKAVFVDIGTHDEVY